MRKKQQQKMFVIVVYCSLLLLFMYKLFVIDKLPDITLPKSFIINESSIELRYLVETTGCRIPFIQTFDDNILRYLKAPKPIKCGNLQRIPDVIKQKRNTLLVKGNKGNVSCCVHEIFRVEPKMDQGDNIYNMTDNCRKLRNNVWNTISEEFVIAKCVVNEIIYVYPFSFVPKKKVMTKLSTTIDSDQLSVLIIGLNSMSRLNFHRQLPKTLQYLKRTMNAVEFLGYNKIDDDTFGNVMALLTGLSFNQTVEFCLQGYYTFIRLDHCSFIWKRFNELNYTTVFAEDYTENGLFQYPFGGFQKQTTDYDYRVFDDLGNAITYNYSDQPELCMGKALRLEKLLNYTKLFAQTFVDHPYFGFFWGASMFVDDINRPQLTDQLYLNLFRELLEGGSLNKTMLFLVSDEGLHMNSVHYLEERLPVMIVYAPRWFRVKYSHAWWNFMANTETLTTPYNVHATLVDLLNIRRLEMNLEPSYIRYEDISRNGRKSLFEPISEEQNCLTADIPTNFCSCHTFFDIPITEYPEVKSMANYLVSNINGMLETEPQCSVLTLYLIITAKVESKDNQLFIIAIETKPGNAIFEATIRRIETNIYLIEGPVNRLNMFGNTSYCVPPSIERLQLTCYCKDLIKNTIN